VEKKNNTLEASVAMRSKMSLTKEFKIAIALLEILVSGCTCFSTDPFEFQMCSKMLLTKEFKIAIALLEIPVSGCAASESALIRLSLQCAQRCH